MMKDIIRDNFGNGRGLMELVTHWKMMMKRRTMRTSRMKRVKMSMLMMVKTRKMMRKKKTMNLMNLMNFFYHDDDKCLMLNKF